MIDIIDVTAPLVQLDEVADDRDEVFLRENCLASGPVRVEPLVDLVAPDASEIVALRGEEQPVQRIASGLAIGRVAGPQQRVDLLERFVFGLGRILEQRVANQHRLGASRWDEHVSLADLLRAQALDDRVGEQLAGLGDHLAGVGIDDIHCDRATHGALAALDCIHLIAKVHERVRREDLDGVDVETAQTVEDFLGQLVAFLHEKLGLVALALRASLLRLELRSFGVVRLTGERDVLGDDCADHFAQVGAALTLLHEIELANGEEETQDVGIGAVAERAEERGGRELLLLVDVDVDHVVDIDSELDPGSAEWDDAGRDETLAIRVSGLLEHDTGRAVKLADDDALSAVDDERPERGQQRQFAEVDLLLDDVLRALAVGRLFEHDELQRRLKRRAVRHVTLDALRYGVLRLADRIALEVEREILVHVRDREQILENALEAEVLPLVLRGVALQQRLERLYLNVEEMGHLHPCLQLCERYLLQRFWHKLTFGHRRKRLRPGCRFDFSASGLEQRVTTGPSVVMVT